MELFGISSLQSWFVDRLLGGNALANNSLERTPPHALIALEARANAHELLSYHQSGAAQLAAAGQPKVK